MIGGAAAYAYANLPRSGLGNMMLVWARAVVFARLNDLPLLVSPWTHMRLGPFLRRERSKRLYVGYFDNQDPIGRLRKLYVLRAYRRVIEPPIEPVAGGPRRRTVYEIGQEPHWSDFFVHLREQRDLVRDALHATLSARSRDALGRLPRPAIGVHVRLSDFATLARGQDFARVGHTRTPMGYFVDVIARIREVHGSSLPATIFSDGHDDELRALLALPNVARARPSADILDLLLLARSRVVVCSAGSSFSAWSAFLADAPAILHPDHNHAPIRPKVVNDVFYEGGPAAPDGATPALLARNIRDIRWGES